MTRCYSSSKRLSKLLHFTLAPGAPGPGPGPRLPGPFALAPHAPGVVLGPSQNPLSSTAALHSAVVNSLCSTDLFAASPSSSAAGPQSAAVNSSCSTDSCSSSSSSSSSGSSLLLLQQQQQVHQQHLQPSSRGHRYYFATTPASLERRAPSSPAPLVRARAFSSGSSGGGGSRSGSGSIPHEEVDEDPPVLLAPGPEDDRWRQLARKLRMVCNDDATVKPVVIGAQGEAATARTLRSIARASEDFRPLEFEVRTAAADDNEDPGRHRFVGDWLRFQVVSKKITWVKFRRMWEGFNKMRRASVGEEGSSSSSSNSSSNSNSGSNNSGSSSAKPRVLKVAAHTQPSKLAKAIINEERLQLGAVIQLNMNDDEALFVASLTLCELRDMAGEDPFAHVVRWPTAKGGSMAYLHCFRHGTARRFREHGERKKEERARRQ